MFASTGRFWVALCASFGICATASAQQGTPERRAVVFIVPAKAAGEPDPMLASLPDALLAQFSLTPIELEIRLDRPSGNLSDRMALATRYAEEARADVACWLELDDKQWFLHIVDVPGRRAIVRPVDASGTQAAIEAVALMTRESASALYSEPPAAPSPPPSAAAAQAEKEPELTPAPVDPAPLAAPRLRLSAGYTVTDFAQQSPLLHGLSLRAAYAVTEDAGLFVGVSATLAPPLEVSIEQDQVEFELWRTPVSATVSYRKRIGEIAFDAEAGAVVEVLYRCCAQAVPPLDHEANLTGAKTNLLIGVAPRLRVEMRITRALGVHLAIGGDILFNTFPYVADLPETTGTTVLLEPYPVRLVGELGMAVYP